MKRMMSVFISLWLSLAGPGLAMQSAPGDDDATPAGPPLRLAVIGLVHGHVAGVLHAGQHRADLEIVGIYEPDRALFEAYARRYGLASDLWFDDLATMLETTQPEAASVMTSTADHRMSVEHCAPRGVHVFIEKPLASSLDDARVMAALAEQHDIHVLTNFETSWYPSVHAAKAMLGTDQSLGPLHRATFRHGHPGPKEIGCGDEFLAWLTDPEGNGGGGAIMDFGCYGAILIAWLTDGTLPRSVSATTRQLKPDVYPRVDDDATIVVTYDELTAVIQPSWNWPHDLKDMTVYGRDGSALADRGRTLTVRQGHASPVTRNAPPRARPYDDPWTYLRAVVHDNAAIDPLSSLRLNLVATSILDAAKASALTGTAVVPETP